MISFFRFVKSCFFYNAKFLNLLSHTLDSCVVLGVKSISIFSILSCILGIVSGMHLSSMLKTVIMSDELIPVGLKNLFFLEFCPTVMCFIYIGKNMTSISGLIYSMKTSGYLDNLKILGINISSYICLPRIVSSTIVYPLLTIVSCFWALIGSAMYCVFINGMNPYKFLASYVSIYNVTYMILCMVKSIIFGFICGIVSSYIGYSSINNKNNDLIKISQRCFSTCCITIIIVDMIVNFIKYYLTN